MAEGQTLTITLDLEAHLARHIGYDENGEPVQGPTTIEDIVLGLVADKLVERVVNHGNVQGRPYWEDIRSRVKSVKDEVIRERVAPLVEQAMTEPIQRTDDFGVPRGEPTTLRAEILKTAQSWLSSPDPSYSADRVRKSRVQKLIADEVDRALTSELKAAVTAAKAEVTAAVQEKGAAVLAETIVKMAGGA